VRALFLTFVLLAGCTNVGVVSQSLEEGVSGVVYIITEPKTPVIIPPKRPTNLSVRPRPRPDNLTQPVLEPYTPFQLRTIERINAQNIQIAELYLGFNENKNRSELRDFMNVDPRSTEWCAAFVNSVLNENNIAGSESVSQTPLMARSFLDWGNPVDHKEEDPILGDVVIFPRGRASWQGHVGFFVESIVIDGKEYWRILGGNQKNSVSIETYDPARALGVRRYQYTQVAEDQQLIRFFRNIFRNVT
jgi:uncharacterized protein (TIGR02594 family)